MFLNVSWHVWVIGALIVVIAIYLILTDDQDLYYYDDIEHDDAVPPEAWDGRDEPDPLDPLSSYYNEENLLGRNLNGRFDER